MSQSEMERFVSDLQSDPELRAEMKSFVQQQAGFELTEEQLGSIVGGLKDQ